MSLSQNNDPDSFRFDPTRPDILESRNSLEIPAREPFEFVAGTRHPTEQELARHFYSSFCFCFIFSICCRSWAVGTPIDVAGNGIKISCVFG